MASFTKLHTTDFLVFQALKKKIRAEKWFFPFADSKVTLYICRVLPEFDRVARVMGRPAGSTGFHQFFLLPVFCLTRTGSATGSTRRAGPGLITLVYTPNPMKKVALFKK